jgi:hypothetical protein
MTFYARETSSKIASTRFSSQSWASFMIGMRQDFEEMTPTHTLLCRGLRLRGFDVWPGSINHPKSIVGVKTLAQNERCVSGIFDNQ